MVKEYKGYKIFQDIKEDEETCIRSGHKYKVNRRPLRSFYVSGIGASCNDSFKSVGEAEKHIDFLIKVNAQNNH